MKHPLLPECYTDEATHRLVLSALSPYERGTRDRITLSNPVVKWDLQKAWDAAQPVLKTARWHYRGIKDDDTPIAEWEMTADNDEEKDNLYTLIAGIIARQIMEPESGYSLLRVEVRKGGEIGLFISGPMQALLRADPEYPNAKYEGLSAEKSARKSIISWAALVRLFKRN
jgi:hypothetical protein